MDILNFISWIKGKRFLTTIDSTKTLIPLGVRDPRRDDLYIAGAMTVEDFVLQLAPGQVGPAGPQGAQGVQGIPGIQGNQGPAGTAGVQGVPGVQGIQGTTGAVGPAGLDWQGAWVSGTSYVADDAVAYLGASYFCILATSGTTDPSADPTHWALLASQGAVGPQGIQGLQGVQGVPGPAGVQGPIGLTGAAGTQGPIGSTGPTGAVGPSGVSGPVGPAGLNWQGVWVSGDSYNLDDAVSFGGASWFCVNATSGTTDPATDTFNWALLASQGAAGINGATGATGAIGATGATGPQGVPGPVGPAGLDWTGVWSASNVYSENDAVSFGGASYFCYNPAGVGPEINDPTVDTANWALLAAQGATGPQGPQGDPINGVVILAAAGAEGTSVLGTVVDTISRSIYIPANTLQENSIVEISWGVYRSTNFGIVKPYVHINVSPSLVGATLIATGESLPAAGPIYSRNTREARINNTTMTIFDINQGSATDTVATHDQSIITIDRTQDYYILFSLRPLNIGDISVVDRVRITEYPTTV